MKILQEFKAFAMRGNVVDLAVAVIIGAAFGKIVSSLVNDVVMPLIGIILGGIDLTGLKIQLTPAVEGVEGATLNYGAFLQTIVDLTIVALAVFFLVKAINSLKFKKAVAEQAAPPPPPEDVALLREIRDLLKDRKS